MAERTSCPLRLATAVWIFAIALSACSPGSPTDGPSTKAQGPATITYSTAAQWRTVLVGVFDKVNAKKLHDKKGPEYVLDEGKTDDDGVTNFYACFDKAPPNARLQPQENATNSAKFSSSPIAFGIGKIQGTSTSKALANRLFAAISLCLTADDLCSS